MTARRRFVAALTIGLSVAACGRGHGQESAPVASAAGVESSGGSAASSVSYDVVVSARCHAADAGAASNVSGSDLEIGDALPDGDGVAVSLVHRVRAATTAAVARLGSTGTGAARVVDLGPTLGDAPPPRLFRHEGRLWAAAYGLPASDAGGASRPLVVYAVPDGAPPEARATIAQQRDDSLAFDAASFDGAALVVWDEATGGSHGVIRAAPVTAEGAGPARDISPAASDAEIPRVVPAASRFVAMWLAHRPDETQGDAQPPSGAEAVGEPRSYGWIETTDVDRQGVATGPVRRLTSNDGHVSAYDAAALADGTVLVAARDDGEASDGSGGSLLRVRIDGARIETPLAFPTDGLGRGAPVLITGSSSWLSWIGPREQMRLLPLDATGAPAGRPSAEDAMSDGRPLLAVGPAASRAVRLFVGLPSHADGPLRPFECMR